jgi:amino acid adenylation domain-containing protein
MTAMLLQTPFERTARRLPDKVALIAGDQRITYGQLHRAASTLAHALRSDGVELGDRVLVMMDSGVEYTTAIHAVLMAGAVLVPVSTQTKTDKLAFLLQDTRGTALLTQAVLASQWRPALQRSPHLRSCRVHSGSRGEPLEHDPRIRAWPGPDAAVLDVGVPRDEQDLAALIYTSGTTGLPKGVMLTHLNMTSAWAAVQAYLGLRESDVIGLALPPVYSYGLYNLLMGLGLGATVVIERHAAFPLRVAQTIERERVTVLPGVPTLFAALLGVPGLERMDMSALRIVTNAAAALPEAHVRRLRSAWPQAKLYLMYGLTECKRASYLPPELVDARPDSVGRGIPNQQHWLVDEQGQRLPHGSTGELVVQGDHVMQGYWERPEESAQRLRDGPSPGQRVLYTGDLFRSDAEGYLSFVARRDDIIKTRGEKVAPREVENTIYLLPGVAGCAVVGVADAQLGQAVKAYVTLAAGSALTEREIIRHCLARLESHMAPQSVDIVEELPRTESGKIRHASLR